VTGSVFYGANAAVAVFSPSQQRITQTLVRHTDRLDTRFSRIMPEEPVLRIRIWIRIHMFLGFLDPDLYL
jgi:hypothetical protein